MADPLENHMNVNTNLSTGRVAWNNFVGGLFWGLGSVIGATIVLAALITVLRTIDFVPLVGNFANSVVNTVQQKQIDQLGGQSSNQSNNPQLKQLQQLQQQLQTK